MSTARFAQLKSIFSHALDLRESEVAAYLDEACGSDERMRSQVEAMLREAADADTVLLTELPTKAGHMLALESTVAGRFVLKQFLGRGGMGEVYRAEDLELGGVVALKTVRTGLLDDSGMQRFRREVQLSRQVTHPNICRVFDVGKEVFGEQELLFLTMEYLEGETLAQRLKRLGPYTPAEAKPVVEQLAAALDALHHKGIMHRDLKPGNVMVDGDRLSLMDFGLARAFSGEDPEAAYTQTGAIVGTPGYMAPEQMLGQPATAASDVYSMGLVVFEMLTGQKASSSDTLAAGKTGLPPEWESLVLQCTAKDAASRPASASDALRLLTVAEPKTLAWSKWALVAAVAVVVAGAVWWSGSKPSAAPTISSSSANDQILKARQLLVRYYKPENVREAITILDGVVQANPDLALAHASLGSALIRTTAERRDPAQIERARVALQRAIALDPEMAEAHVTLGNLYLEEGKRDLARSELKRARDLDGKSPDVYFALAQLYRAEDRVADKEAAIQRAIDLAPDNWMYHNWRSMDFRDQGRNQQALDELAIAGRLMPDNPLVYNNMGVVNLRMRKFEDAIRAFQKSNELEPRSKTLGNVGAAYYMLGRYDEAAATLAKVVEMDERSYVMRANLAAALDRLPGRKQDAIASYRKAIELAQPLLKATPNDYRLLGNLASYHAIAGDRAEALALIRRALALKPESPDVANRAVAVFEFLKDRETALHWAAKALENGYPMESLRSDPELAGLRADPRFHRLEVTAKEKPQ